MKLCTILRTILRTTAWTGRSAPHAAPGGARRRLRVPVTHPATYAVVAAAGALAVSLLTTGDRSAHASPQPPATSVAQQLSLPARTPGFGLGDLEPAVEDPTSGVASRGQRDQLQSAAEQAQAAAIAEQQRREAEAAAAKAAAEEAARQKAAADAAAQVAAMSGNPSAIQSWTASFMQAQYGWGADQMSCLVPLWNRESGWRVSAANPSGAYGIPQSLPGSKMASAGADWQTNPQTQVKWGLSYIKATYGTPCGAWAHSQGSGWY
jgi:hypothetical protein